jgi:hypothetical protein
MNSLRQNLLERVEFNFVFHNRNIDKDNNFIEYLSRMGFLGESELLVLSQENNYCFSQSNLKDLKVLVILKRLDKLRHPGTFLNIIGRLVPFGAYLVGCFTPINSFPGEKRAYLHSPYAEKRTTGNYEIISGLYTGRLNIPGMLVPLGFKIIDTTEIKGLTYISCQNTILRL